MHTLAAWSLFPFLRSIGYILIDAPFSFRMNSTKTSEPPILFRAILFAVFPNFATVYEMARNLLSHCITHCMYERR